MKTLLIIFAVAIGVFALITACVYCIIMRTAYKHFRELEKDFEDEK